MQFQLIIKDENGNTVVETDFMSRGPINMIPTSDWQSAIEAFVDTARMLSSMSPSQSQAFIAQALGPDIYKKAA